MASYNSIVLSYWGTLRNSQQSSEWVFNLENYVELKTEKLYSLPQLYDSERIVTIFTFLSTLNKIHFR